MTNLSHVDFGWYLLGSTCLAQAVGGESVLPGSPTQPLLLGLAAGTIALTGVCFHLVGKLRATRALLPQARQGTADQPKGTEQASPHYEAQHKLNQSLSLLHATFESTADGILVVDLQGRVAGFNRNFLILWRLDAELANAGDDAALLRAVVAQLRDPEDFLRRVGELYASPTACSFDVVHFKDGRTFERYSQPQWMDEQVVGRVWSFRDVTERARAETALRDSESRLRQLAEALDKVFWSWQREPSRFVYVSPAFENLWQVGCQDLLEDPGRWWAGIHEEDRDQVESSFHLWVAQGGQGGYQQTFRVVHGAGESLRWVVQTGAAIHDEGGQVVQVVGLAEDVTDAQVADHARRNLEVQLFQSQKMEALGTLAGGIAHDFNNVLTAIVGNAELGLSDLSSDHPVRDNLEEILKASHRARDVVVQILTFSRRREQKKKRVHLANLIDEALRLLRASLPASVELVADLRAEHCDIEADPSQIHQILMNLCTNAAQAVEAQGRVAVACSLVATTADQRLAHPQLNSDRLVKLVVQDDGPGIAPEIRDRIFEPFFSTKGGKGGTGLGLPVVHGIVENHLGWIELHSEPGLTRFEVYFPQCHPGLPESRPEKAVVAKGTGQRILLVDDEPAVARAATQGLRRLGYQVTVENEPCAALERLQLGPQEFDLLVTDYNMPNMNGLELARRVKLVRPDFPVVMMSGYSQGISGRMWLIYILWANLLLLKAWVRRFK